MGGVLLSRPSLLGVVFAGVFVPARGLVRGGLPTAPFIASPPTTLGARGTGQSARFSRGTKAPARHSSSSSSSEICDGSDDNENDPDAAPTTTVFKNWTGVDEKRTTGVARGGMRAEGERRRGRGRGMSTQQSEAIGRRRVPGVRHIDRRTPIEANGRFGTAEEEFKSPAEEQLEARNIEVAIALAAAKRGRGERGRFVESEAPVEEFIVRGRHILVKRDDKMRLAGSGLSGNKARKLYALNKVPDDAFPKLVASHGGIQSNAMVAIAAVVATKRGSSFVYYTKPVPRWLRKNPVGNFARAMALGAEIIEVHPEDYKRVFGGADGPGAGFAEVVPEKALFLPQGGADKGAEEGVSMLAEEIADYWDTNGPPGKKLRVVLPAGTGTTALFLARHLIPAGIAVCAIPCAGNGSYLLRQMTKVDRASGRVGIFPEIVEADEKAAFGVPKRELLDVWRELDGLGLLVDLLYASPAWEVLFKEWDRSTAGSPLATSAGGSNEAQLMYLHCGGLEGISSQLTRYKHQGLVEDRQLQ